MPDLRDMELLAALARHSHFARAADECGISQPAFSSRIRNLELDLGAPIVRRGNRFAGFTPEGEIALRWAHRLIADSEGLRQEIRQARDELSGNLAIGVVPTALSYVANLAGVMRQRHPGLRTQIYSRSAAEISQGVERFELDAGVTYLQSSTPSGFIAQPLFAERYELLAPPDMVPADVKTITWAEVAEFPLCLLTRNMMNRRIIDDAFNQAGVTPNVVMETNAFTAALVQVGSGTAATIASDTLAEDTMGRAEIVRIPLVDPELTKQIGIVIADRKPLLPSVQALMNALDSSAR
ncbi:MAG: LysR family transcriptional regulator [Pseudomonadota bacterium]